MNSKKKSDRIKEGSLTYQDYASLSDDGKQYELVNGVLQLMTPAPHPIHQLVSQEFAYQLKQNCEDEYIIFVAPIDLILSEQEVRQPDLLMIHKNRLDIVTERGIEGSPNLVLEILSPTSIKRDRLEKQFTYAAYGIQEYWLVDPIQKFLEQYVLKNERYILNEVYLEDNAIKSSQVSCATFSMDDIFNSLPDLPNI